AYLYPEGFLFHVPGVAALTLIAIARSGDRIRKVAALVGSAVMCGLWICPGYAYTVGMGIAQAKGLRALPVDWGRCFDSYLVRLAARLTTGWPGRAIDVLAGVQGLYFLTPGDGDGWWMRLGIRVVLAGLCVGVVAASIVVFRAAMGDGEIGGI